MRLFPVLALPLILTACSGPATDPSGASPGEARQLNEAAAMLDVDSVSTNALGVNQANQASGETE